MPRRVPGAPAADGRAVTGQPPVLHLTGDVAGTRAVADCGGTAAARPSPA